MSANSRSRESQRGALGASTNTHDYAKTALIALQGLKYIGNTPKFSSHGHRQNVIDRVEDGSAALEFRHVLMDYSAGNVQLKARMMTRLEAYNRNATLRGTGFAWALCSK